MAELDQEIVYRKGEKNLLADILSCYGVDGVVEATASAWYSLSDSSIRRIVYNWLNVVAKQLDFHACVTAAIEALSR